MEPRQTTGALHRQVLLWCGSFASFICSHKSNMGCLYILFFSHFYASSTPAAHDFLLTDHYYIFHRTPMYNFTKINTTKILTGISGPGQLMRWYHHLPSSIVLIPRLGYGSLQFYDTEPCMIYHHRMYIPCILAVGIHVLLLLLNKYLFRILL